MWRHIKKHIKLGAIILVVTTLVLLGLIAYQKGSAKKYFAGQGCEAGTSRSAGCTHTCVSYGGQWLGLVITYKYQPFSCPGQLFYTDTCPPASVYSGKIFSIPGKHFIFDTKIQSFSGACAD